VKLDLAPFRRELEFAEQRALFSACFPETAGKPPEAETFYRGKFTHYPANPPSYEYVARDEAGMAGYYAALPYEYAVSGERFRCGMVCDVMTAPRLRGRGVFTKLGAYSLDELARAGVDFVSGYPRRAAVIPGHLKVGWQIACKLPLYMLPLKTGALLRSRRMEFLTPVANAAVAAVRAALTVAQPRHADIETRTWGWRRFLAEVDLDAFSSRWRSRQRHSLVKSRAFLEWRLSFQDADYRVVSAHRGNELVGVSIVRACEPEGVRSLALMDLMCADRDAEVLAAMLNPWAALAEEWGAETVLTMMSEHHADRLDLWRFGFIKTPVSFFLILKALSERARQKLSHGAVDWSAMWIDSDDL
jgi:GNAT superfamily N-acetyltransferase